MYPVTEITISVTGKQSYNMNTVTWNNKTCNMNRDPYDKNINTSHACILVNIYVLHEHAILVSSGTVMCKHGITEYRAGM